MIKNGKRARTFGVNLELLKSLRFEDVRLIYLGIKQCEIGKEILQFLTPTEIIYLFYGIGILNEKNSKINGIDEKVFLKDLIKASKTALEEKEKKGISKSILIGFDEKIIGENSDFEKRIDLIEKKDLQKMIQDINEKKEIIDPNMDSGSNRFIYIRKILEELEKRKRLD